MSQVWAVALYDFDAETENDLQFSQNDKILITNRDEDWWYGQVNGRGKIGVFPNNYVSIEQYRNNNTSRGPPPKPKQGYNNKMHDVRLSPKPTQNTNLINRNVQINKKKNNNNGGRKGAVKKRQIAETKYGLFASNMALFSCVVLLVQALGSVVWYDSSEIDINGDANLFIVVYSLSLAVGLYLFERVFKYVRSGSHLPIRGIMYLFFAIPLFVTPAGALSGLCLTMSAIMNIRSACNGETEKPPRKRGGKNKQGKDYGDLDNPSCCQRIGREILILKEQDKCGMTLFLILYFLSNAVIFINALVIWIDRNTTLGVDTDASSVIPPCTDRLEELGVECRDLDDIELGLGSAKLSEYGPWAKAFGNTLDFNCSIILMPVLRTLLRGLYNRSTRDQGCFAVSLRGLLKLFPLDHALEFHKLVAKMIVVGVVGHTAMHFVNIGLEYDNTLSAFGLWPWYSGVLIIGCMCIIYPGAGRDVKTGHFEIFWYGHHAFIAFFALILSHGNGGFNPNFWRWFIGPGILYVGERLLRASNAKKEITLMSVTFSKPDVFCLEFKKDGPFAKYKEGQYVFIKCPRVSEYQWHPFTISSAPQQETVTVHIKLSKKGSWTYEVCEYLKQMGERDASWIEFKRNNGREQVAGRILGPDQKQIIQIDGPHSAPTQHLSEYVVDYIVGSGIGVTPLASSLKSIVLRKWPKNIGKQWPTHAYFTWCCRHSDIDSFRWLVRTIKEAADQITHMKAQNILLGKTFRMDLYITSVPDGKSEVYVDDGDVGFWGIPQEEHQIKRSLAKFSSEDLYAIMKNPPQHIELDCNIHIWNGRMNAEQRFQEIVKNHPNGEIGVMFCGNPYISETLKYQCHKHSSLKDGRIFRLHSENF